MNKPSHVGDNWILKDQFNMMAFKIYGIMYFNNIDNQLYLECSY